MFRKMLSVMAILWSLSISSPNCTYQSREIMIKLELWKLISENLNVRVVYKLFFNRFSMVFLPLIYTNMVFSAMTSIFPGLVVCGAGNATVLVLVQLHGELIEYWWNKAHNKGMIFFGRHFFRRDSHFILWNKKWNTETKHGINFSIWE